MNKERVEVLVDEWDKKVYPLDNPYAYGFREGFMIALKMVLCFESDNPENENLHSNNNDNQE